MAYYIVAYKKGKAICGSWCRANTQEKALEDMDWRMAIYLPDIEYDDLQVTQQEE